MSKPILVKTLKELEENKYITYELIRECVKGFITPSELELYCFMRYLHNEQQRLGLA